MSKALQSHHQLAPHRKKYRGLNIFYAGSAFILCSVAILNFYSFEQRRAGWGPAGSFASPYGLVVPEHPAVALPSIITSADEESSIDRKFYGGLGDKKHLGGFTSFDPMGVCLRIYILINWIYAGFVNNIS